MHKDRSDRLKAFLIIELVLIVIALVMPITPSKTGRPFAWPADISTYSEKVLVAFAMGNGIVIVIGVLVWVYGLVSGRRSTE